jgi:hypothetical protein
MPKFTLHEPIAIEIMLAAGYQPLESYPGSANLWLVKCIKCGQEFRTTYQKVKVGDLKNCSNCKSSGKKKFANDAAEIMKSAGLTPLREYPGKNNAPWKSECQRCGSIVKPSFSSIKSGGKGCVKCGIAASAKAKVIPNEVAVKLMVAANLKPLDPYVSARAKWRCECLKCGKIVFANYNAIQQGEGGCSTCGRTSSAAKQRGSSLVAVDVMEKKGLKPLAPYQNSNAPWKCQCLVCGEIVEPTYNNVKFRQQNFGCIYCMGGRVSEKQAIEKMIAAGVIPIDKYPGKDTNWKSRCIKCSRIVKPTYANARRGQGGCKYCAEHGIDMFAPTYLYVLFHEEFNAFKVGIGKIGTNKKTDRITKLMSDGWSLLKKYDFDTGMIALTYESWIFYEVRNVLNIPIYMDAKSMKKTFGHTETMDAELITDLQLIKLVEKILKRKIPEIDLYENTSDVN